MKKHPMMRPISRPGCAGLARW